MTGDNMTEIASLKTRRSISQLALAFAGVGLLFGMLVMSPDGRFAGFMIMAVGGPFRSSAVPDAIAVSAPLQR